MERLAAVCDRFDDLRVLVESEWMAQYRSASVRFDLDGVDGARQRITDGVAALATAAGQAQAQLVPLLTQSRAAGAAEKIGKLIPRVAQLSVAAGQVRARVQAELAKPLQTDPRTAQTTAVIAIGDAEVLAGELRSSLLPAYRGAAAALDTEAIAQLGGATAAALARLDRLMGQVDLASGAAARDPAQADMLLRAAKLRSDVHALQTELSVQMSPQLMGDQTLGGKLETPEGAGTMDGVLSEAQSVHAILATVDEVRELLSGEDTGEEVSRQPTPEERREAAAKVEVWRGRPANWRFLVTALKREGLWEKISGTKVMGKSLDQVGEGVEANAAWSGAMADVGRYDDQHVDEMFFKFGGERPLEVYGDEEAQEIMRLAHDANAQGRRAILQRMIDKGQLEPLAVAVPANQLRALVADLPNSDPLKKQVISVLHVGGGRSLTGMADDFQGDMLARAEAAKDDLIMGRDPMDAMARQNFYESTAGIVEFGKTAYHSLTGGITQAHDQGYDAYEKGEVSRDDFHSAVTNQVIKTALVGTGSGMLGAAAGGWGRGFAQLFTKNRVAQNIIGGVTGGTAAGVADVGLNDFADLVLTGEAPKREFGDYFDSALTGGLMGGFAASLPAVASHYLPEEARSTAQLYAERHPQLEDAVRRAEVTGAIHAGDAAGVIDKAKAGAQRLVLTAREVLDLDGSMFGGQLKPRLAMSGVDVRALTPDSPGYFEVEVDVPGIAERRIEGRVVSIRHAKPLTDGRGSHIFTQLPSGKFAPNALYAGGKFPLDEDLLQQYPEGVSFTKDGYPDFRAYVTSIKGRPAVVNLPELAATRKTDFDRANRAMGLDATPDGFVWHHHQNGKTMMLIPEDLHEAVRHGGGVANSK